MDVTYDEVKFTDLVLYVARRLGGDTSTTSTALGLEHHKSSS